MDIAAATRSVNLRLQQEIASLGLLLALFLLLTPLALFMMRRGIVHPIQDLARAADAVATGRFGQTTRVTSTDEIGTLQRAFNHMVHDLRAQRAALRQRNSDLQHSLAELEQAQARLREREEQYRAYVERTVLSG